MDFEQEVRPVTLGGSAFNGSLLHSQLVGPGCAPLHRFFVFKKHGETDTQTRSHAPTMAKRQMLPSA